MVVDRWGGWCRTQDSWADLVAGLRAEMAVLRVTNTALIAANVALTEATVRLQALLNESRPRGKHQAAPFSKGDPTRNPETPGHKNKQGAAHGRRGSRPISDRVDRELHALLPDRCSRCGGTTVADGVNDQFVCDVPQSRGLKCYGLLFAVLRRS